MILRKVTLIYSTIIVLACFGCEENKDFCVRPQSKQFINNRIIVEDDTIYRVPVSNGDYSCITFFVDSKTNQEYMMVWTGRGIQVFETDDPSIIPYEEEPTRKQ